MGTLSSTLGPYVDRLTARPRLYADANVPAGLVSFMRQHLHWDVLFVIEDDGLRRAADVRHYQLARQLQRTLVTLDRDFLDDRRFPPAESGGVLVLSAPDDRAYRRLLRRLDAAFFRTLPTMSGAGREVRSPLPLAGRKLYVHADWQPGPPHAEAIEP